ncbi:MAG: methyltransferase domain-containing protein [Alphaproteobacteria bacterium]|nr:methyltransferase domain-containing protein [Alphaproteobacteria bacterium]
MIATSAADAIHLRRRHRLLAGLDTTTAAVLEIGALNRPLAVGATVRYADHLDTAGLQHKYRDDPVVDCQRIVPVSYVLDGRPLSEIVGEARFDAIVASHVIEHVPDVIGWLAELHAILRPGGRVFLYIPDGRYCFDYQRPLTTAGQLLDAHRQQRKRPSPGAVLDGLGLMTHAAANNLWRAGAVRVAAGVTGEPSHGPLDTAWPMVRLADAGEYVDVHCHVFSPSSFITALAALIQGDLVGFGVVDFAETAPGDLEFLVVLERSDLAPGPERQAALLATLPAPVNPADPAADARSRLFEALDRARHDLHDERVASAHRVAALQHRIDQYRDEIEALRLQGAELRQALTTVTTARDEALAILRKVRWVASLRVRAGRMFAKLFGRS